MFDTIVTCAQNASALWWCNPNITSMPMLWAFRTKVKESSDVVRTILRQLAAASRSATLMALALVHKSHALVALSCSLASVFPHHMPH
jgi:hypothetical protein